MQGYHTILIGPYADVESKDPKMAQEVSRPVLPLFRSLKSIDALKRNEPSVSILTKALPDNIHLLTCTQWPIEEESGSKEIKFTPKQVLLRLQNIATDKNREPTDINIEHLLTIGTTKRATEVSLTANQNSTEMRKNRLQWPTEMKENGSWHADSLVVGVKPGEIKTLILEF